MMGHLAHSACEAPGPRRKPRLGGEAAHRFPRAAKPIGVTFSILVTVSMTKSSCPYLPPTPQCFGQEGVHLLQSFRFLKQHGQAHQG
jgi:hypothetical protein